MSDWQPMTIKPPRPGQYHVRVRITEGRYLSKLVRYWDGTQWSSRNGRLPTGFGNWGDLSQQFWREIAAQSHPPSIPTEATMPDLPYVALLGIALGAVVALALALHRWLSREIEKEEREE